MTLVTEAKLDANDYQSTWWQLDGAQREEVCKWIAAHGLDPASTMSIERDLIDCPLIRAEIHVTDAEGRYLINTAGDGPMVTTRELAERYAAPGWWQPR